VVEVSVIDSTPPPFVMEVLEIFLTFLMDDIMTTNTYLESGKGKTDLLSRAFDKQHLAFAHGGT